MMFETPDIEEWTGRLRVWTYWTQPKTIPTRHTARPAMRTADPLREPPMNDTAFRSGMLMSDSLARAEGMRVAGTAAAAPNCHSLGDFILKGRGLGTCLPENCRSEEFGRAFCGRRASIRPVDGIKELRKVVARLGEPCLRDGDAGLVIAGRKGDPDALYAALGVGSLGAERDPGVGGPRGREAFRGPSLGPAVVVTRAFPGGALRGHLRLEHPGELRDLVGARDLLDQRAVPVGVELVKAAGPEVERVAAPVVGKPLRGGGVRDELHRPVGADPVEPVADVERLVLVADEVDEHEERLALRDPPVAAALEDAHRLADHMDDVVGAGEGAVGLVGRGAERDVDVVPLAVLGELRVELERLRIGAERARVECRGPQLVHPDGDRGQVVVAEYLDDVAPRVGGQVLPGDSRQRPVALHAPGVGGRGECKGQEEGEGGPAGCGGHVFPQARPFPAGLERKFWGSGGRRPLISPGPR